MNKLLPILASVFLSVNLSFCQERIIFKEAAQQIVTRAQSYETTILLADSLYAAYNKIRFFVAEDENQGLENGLTFTLRLYNKARKQTRKKEYCDSMIDRIMIQCQLELQQEEDEQYQRIIDKGEEYFVKGDLKKAIELYERAVTLRPSDEKAKKRLEELKAEKAKRDEKQY